MIIPIRCFTCNNLIADKWDNPDETGYLNYLKKGHSKKEAMDKVGLHRYCCRTMILSHIDLINTLIKYS